MPGSWTTGQLPHLAEGDNCEVTSKKTPKYNCIAWAAGEDFRNWWPDPMKKGYWPPGVSRAITVGAFIEAYGTLGFKLAYDGTLQAGIQKLAIYGKGQAGAEVPTHAALQLEDGQWTSKLGPLEDVTHKVAAAVEGPCYGKVICYLGRPRP
jgi:hypothetical protein